MDSKFKNIWTNLKKKEFDGVKSCQMSKLEKMKTRGMQVQVCYAQVETFINISKCQLTTSEKSALNKSLNFTMTIKWIPYIDLINPIKEAAFLKNP